MLNYVAFYLVSWMLRTPGLLQAPGSSNPKTPPMKDTAILPELLGPQYNLHFGFILVIARDGAGVVDPQPLEPRASSSARSARTRTRRGSPASTSTACTSRHAHRRWARGSRRREPGARHHHDRASRRTSTPASASTRSPSHCSVVRPRGARSRRAVLFGAFKAGGFSMQAAAADPDRHRHGRPGAHRAVHRRAAAGADDLLPPVARAR